MRLIQPSLLSSLASDSLHASKMSSHIDFRPLQNSSSHPSNTVQTHPEQSSTTPPLRVDLSRHKLTLTTIPWTSINCFSRHIVSIIEDSDARLQVQQVLTIHLVIVSHLLLVPALTIALMKANPSSLTCQKALQLLLWPQGFLRPQRRRTASTFSPLSNCYHKYWILLSSLMGDLRSEQGSDLLFSKSYAAY